MKLNFAVAKGYKTVTDTSANYRPFPFAAFYKFCRQLIVVAREVHITAIYNVKVRYVIGCVLTSIASSQAGSAQTQEVVTDATVKHAVVFHRPGLRWDRRIGFPQTISRHIELYKSLARNCTIIMGGRLEGRPILGMSVFNSQADMSKIRSVLEKDPAVVEGIVALEFRTLAIQLGTAPSCAISGDK